MDLTAMLCMFLIQALMMLSDASGCDTVRLEGSYWQHTVDGVYDKLDSDGCSGRPVYRQTWPHQKNYLFYFKNTTSWQVGRSLCKSEALVYAKDPEWAISPDLLGEDTVWKETYQDAWENNEHITTACAGADLCHSLTLHSTSVQSSREGTYTMMNDTVQCTNRPVWKKVFPTDSTQFLFYHAHSAERSRWQIGSTACEDIVGLLSQEGVLSPDRTQSTWMEYKEGLWTNNPAIKTFCNDQIEGGIETLPPTTERTSIAGIPEVTTMTVIAGHDEQYAPYSELKAAYIVIIVIGVVLVVLMLAVVVICMVKRNTSKTDDNALNGIIEARVVYRPAQRSDCRENCEAQTPLKSTPDGANALTKPDDDRYSNGPTCSSAAALSSRQLPTPPGDSVYLQPKPPVRRISEDEEGLVIYEEIH